MSGILKISAEKNIHLIMRQHWANFLFFSHDNFNFTGIFFSWNGNYELQWQQCAFCNVIRCRIFCLHCLIHGLKFVSPLKELMWKNCKIAQFFLVPNSQCSKIRKKYNFKSIKKYYLHFQKWQKVHFCRRKKFKTTNAIFGLFSGAKINFLPFLKWHIHNVFLYFWNCTLFLILEDCGTFVKKIHIFMS